MANGQLEEPASANPTTLNLGPGLDEIEADRTRNHLILGASGMRQNDIPTKIEDNRSDSESMNNAGLGERDPDADLDESFKPTAKTLRRHVYEKIAPCGCIVHED
ncbi:hypothetical protein ABW21_db0203418 [Orbilia brochopaga]|nr:hypothetical protein ABW21_db0203418 [Drechslerella brochopaga]